MTLRLLQKTTTSSTSVYLTLFRAFLTKVVGLNEVYSTSNFSSSEIIAGTTGSVLSQNNFVFTDASADFSAVTAGMYLCVSGSSISSNKGVYYIAYVADAHTLVLAPGPQGSQFVTDINMKYAIIDTSIVSVGDYFVIRSTGNTSPEWEAKFEIDATHIRFQQAPFGGWSNVIHAWQPGVVLTSNHSILTTGTNNTFYTLADTNFITTWIENALGTAPAGIMFLGCGNTYRPGFDPSFTVAGGFAGNLLPTSVSGSAFSRIESTNTSNNAIQSFTCMVPFTASSGSVFLGQKPNLYDLRVDSAPLSVANDDTLNSTSEIRGALRGFSYCSTLLPYKSFVNNGRTLVSLGSGVAVSWPSSALVVLCQTLKAPRNESEKSRSLPR
jgi:hypothetical protein